MWVISIGALATLFFVAVPSALAQAEAAASEDDHFAVSSEGSTRIPGMALLTNDDLPEALPPRGRLRTEGISSDWQWYPEWLEAPRGRLTEEGGDFFYEPVFGFGEDRFGYRPRAGAIVGPTAEVVLHVRPGTLPVVGDWNCDGAFDIGWFDSEHSTFMLCNDGDAANCRALTMPVGEAGWQPILGNWNEETCADFGVYDPASGRLFVESELGNTRLRAIDGPTGAHPFALDRDGDGVDEIGFYQSRTARVFWADGSLPERFAPSLVPVEDGLPAVGDWNGDGRESLAVYESSTGLLVHMDARQNPVHRRLPSGRYAISWPRTFAAAGWASHTIGIYDFETRALYRYRVDHTIEKVALPDCPEDPVEGCGWPCDCEDYYNPPPTDPPPIDDNPDCDSDGVCVR